MINLVIVGKALNQRRVQPLKPHFKIKHYTQVSDLPQELFFSKLFIVLPSEIPSSQYAFLGHYPLVRILLNTFTISNPLKIHFFAVGQAKLNQRYVYVQSLKDFPQELLNNENSITQLNVPTQLLSQARQLQFHSSVYVTENIKSRQTSARPSEQQLKSPNLQNMVFISNSAIDLKYKQMEQKYKNRIHYIESTELIAESSRLDQITHVTIVSYVELKQQVQRSIVLKKCIPNYRFLSTQVKLIVLVGLSKQDIRVIPLLKKYTGFKLLQIDVAKLGSLRENCNKNTQLIFIGQLFNKQAITSSYKDNKSRPNVLLVLFQKQLLVKRRVISQQRNVKSQRKQHIQAYFKHVGQISESIQLIKFSAICNNQQKKSNCIVKKQIVQEVNIMLKGNLKVQYKFQQKQLKELDTKHFVNTNDGIEFNKIQQSFEVIKQQLKQNISDINVQSPVKIINQQQKSKVKLGDNFHFQSIKVALNTEFSENLLQELKIVNSTANIIKSQQFLNVFFSKIQNNIDRSKNIHQFYQTYQQKAFDDQQVSLNNQQLNSALQLSKQMQKSSSQHVQLLNKSQFNKQEQASLNLQFNSSRQQQLEQQITLLIQPVISKQLIQDIEYNQSIQLQNNKNKADQHIKVFKQDATSGYNQKKQPLEKVKQVSVQTKQLYIHLRESQSVVLTSKNIKVVQVLYTSSKQIGSKIDNWQQQNQLEAKIKRKDISRSRVSQNLLDIYCQLDESKVNSKHKIRIRQNFAQNLEPIPSKSQVVSFVKCISQQCKQKSQRIPQQSFSIEETTIQNHIKVGHRVRNSRLRAVLIGKSPLMKVLVRQITAAYKQQVLVSVFEEYFVYRQSSKRNSFPTILIFDERGKEAALLQANRQHDNLKLNIFILAREPSNLLNLFRENDRISFLCHNLSGIVAEFDHYLGRKQKSLIAQERRSKYGRLRVLVPQGLQLQFDQLAKESNNIVFIESYLDQRLFLNRLKNQVATCIVLQGKDYNPQLLNHKDLHLFILTDYPSEMQNQLGKVSMLALSCKQIAKQLINYVGNEGEVPFVRKTASSYARLTVFDISKVENKWLIQLFSTVKEQIPQVQIRRTEELSKASGVVLVDDSSAKAGLAAIKQNLKMLMIIYTTAPSLYRIQFQRNQRIVAVSHLKQQIAQCLKSLIKLQQPFCLLPSQRVGKLNVYLVAQAQIDINTWQAPCRQLSCTVLESREKLIQFDLFGPSIIQTNQLDFFNCYQYVKKKRTQTNNHLIFLLLKSAKPSNYHKLIQDEQVLIAVSPDSSFLMRAALSLLNLPNQQSPSMVKRINRRSYSDSQALFISTDQVNFDNASQKLSCFLPTFQLKVLPERMNLDKPTLIFATIGDLSPLLKSLSSKHPYYFFLQCDVPTDYKGLLLSIPHISAVSRCPIQLAEEALFYCKKSNKDTTIRKYGQRIQFESATVIFLKMANTPFQSDAEQIDQKIRPLADVAWLNNQQQLLLRLQLKKPLLIVFNQLNQQQAVKFANENFDCEYLRVLLLTNRPELYQTKVKLHKRIVFAGRAEALLSQLKEYLPHNKEKKRLRRWLVRIQRDEVKRIRSTSFLRVGQGNLVCRKGNNSSRLKRRSQSVRFPFFAYAQRILNSAGV